MWVPMQTEHIYRIMCINPGYPSTYSYTTNTYSYAVHTWISAHIHIPQIHVHNGIHLHTGVYIAYSQTHTCIEANYSCIHIPCTTAYMCTYILTYALMAHPKHTHRYMDYHITHAHIYICTCNDCTDAYTTTHVHCTYIHILRHHMSESDMYAHITYEYTHMCLCTLCRFMHIHIHTYAYLHVHAMTEHGQPGSAVGWSIAAHRQAESGHAQGPSL